MNRSQHLQLADDKTPVPDVVAQPVEIFSLAFVRGLHAKIFYAELCALPVINQAGDFVADLQELELPLVRQIFRRLADRRLLRQYIKSLQIKDLFMQDPELVPAVELKDAQADVVRVQVQSEHAVLLQSFISLCV